MLAERRRGDGGMTAPGPICSVFFLSQRRVRGLVYELVIILWMWVVVEKQQWIS